MSKLMANPVFQVEGWVVYRPVFGFMENAQSPGMLSLLTRQPRLTARRAAELRIDQAVFEPLAKVHQRLTVADQGPFQDVAFKRVYALLRADIVLVDLNVPDQGCRSQEAMLAYLADIPVVGIAHRFVVSPTMAEKLDALLFPTTSDQIVRQVLAFDPKVTATIQHYREAEQRRQLEQLSEKAAELKAAEDVPDGGNESAR
jgi:hypothetical protein